MNNRFKFLFSIVCFLISTFSFAGIIGYSNVCKGTTNKYFVESILNATSYTWTLSNGWKGTSTSNSISVTFDGGDGILSVEIKRSAGVDINYDISITVDSLFHKASFIPSTTVLDSLNLNVVFTNNSINGEYYLWDFGDGLTSNEKDVSHTYSADKTDYKVILSLLITNSGCIDTVSCNIHVNQNLLYFVPNSFTPNGDQFNNVFTPVILNNESLTDYHLSIYNRSEGLIFESYNPKIGWNGTFGDKNQLMEDGIYTWILDMKDDSNDKSYSVKGHVHLLK